MWNRNVSKIKQRQQISFYFLHDERISKIIYVFQYSYIIYKYFIICWSIKSFHIVHATGGCQLPSIRIKVKLFELFVLLNLVISTPWQIYGQSIVKLAHRRKNKYLLWTFLILEVGHLADFCTSCWTFPCRGSRKFLVSSED